MLFGLKIFGYMRSVLVYGESLNVVNSGAERTKLTRICLHFSLFGT